MFVINSHIYQLYLTPGPDKRRAGLNDLFRFFCGLMYMRFIKTTILFSSSKSSTCSYFGLQSFFFKKFEILKRYRKSTVAFKSLTFLYKLTFMDILFAFFDKGIMSPSKFHSCLLLQNNIVNYSYHYFFQIKHNCLFSGFIISLKLTGSFRFSTLNFVLCFFLPSRKAQMRI